MDDYIKESKKFHIEKQVERLANELYLYYKYFKHNQETIDTLYNTLIDEIVLSKKEVDEIINGALQLLEVRYELIINNMDPLIITKIKGG